MIKFLDILKESISNPENIILPFNIYYADSDSKLRDIGLDSGILTEPDLMFTLWNEYQQINPKPENRKCPNADLLLP